MRCIDCAQRFTNTDDENVTQHMESNPLRPCAQPLKVNAAMQHGFYQPGVEISALPTHCLDSPFYSE